MGIHVCTCQVSDDTGVAELMSGTDLIAVADQKGKSGLIHNCAQMVGKTSYVRRSPSPPPPPP
eukprot:COSAG05_NODE_19410_length_293_cov_0.798969_1_plen_62_part_01